MHKVSKETKQIMWVLLLCSIAVILAFAISALVIFGINAAEEKEAEEKYNTFIATRYFFRFDYPENFQAEKNEYGFYLDEDEKLVARVYSDDGFTVLFYYINTSEAEEEQIKFSGNKENLIQEENVVNSMKQEFTVYKTQDGLSKYYFSEGLAGKYKICACAESTEIFSSHAGELGKIIDSFKLSDFDD